MRRLTFVYRDGQIELIDQRPVEMTLPAETAVREPGERAEFWCELRSAEAEVLYRRETPDPIPTDVEVFSDDPEQSIERAPHPPREGVFSVVVPEIEAADEVLLLRSLPGPPPRRGARRLADVGETAEAVSGVVEVGRFKLRKD